MDASSSPLKPLLRSLSFRPAQNRDLEDPEGPDYLDPLLGGGDASRKEGSVSIEP